MVKNYTPHTINIYRKDDVIFNEKQRKYFVKDGAQPTVSIPSSGVLSAKIEYQPIEDIDNIPQYKPQVKGIDPLPDGEELIVVSALYVSAAQLMGLDVSRLRTISQPVYSNPDNPRPCGCLGLNLVK